MTVGELKAILDCYEKTAQVVVSGETGIAAEIVDKIQEKDTGRLVLLISGIDDEEVEVQFKKD